MSDSQVRPLSEEFVSGRFSVSALLKKTGAVTLPESVLIGAILEIVSEYNRSTAEKINEWAMVGESFLRGADLALVATLPKAAASVSSS